jgi:hypothetical protein
MSQLATRIFGAVAVVATVGAAQFASGHDLSGLNISAAAQPSAAISEATVNRAAKADRAAGTAAPAAQTRTISLRLEALSDTSVLIRLPLVQETRGEARSRAYAPSITKSGNGRMKEACEPMVSVLTEVAKQLQPGRCVT